MQYTSLKVGSWKLTDLVKDPAGNEFQRFMRSIETETEQFEARRKDLNPAISSIDFEKLIHLIEDVYEKISIATGYAHLQYYADTSSNEAAAFVTKMEKMASDISNRLLFFDLWFKKEIDEKNAQRLINSVSPVYREYLRHKRLLAKHSLTEPEEKIVNTISVTGLKALVKIYDKMTSSFEFIMTIKKGKKVIRRAYSNKEKMLSLIRSPKPEEREAAYKALWQVYKKNSGVLGEIYQNIVIRWRDEGISMRGYKSPISVRNVANDLDDSTVEALLAVCRRNSAIFQDYFREKAKMIGVKKLRRYDLYAPLSSKTSDQKKFTYGKAVETVLKTFEAFNPQFRTFAEQVFDEQHVDSALRNGKRGGAFCYTISPKRTPYVLLNFDGKTRDVSTLAHEFGHAIHSMTAADKPLLVSQAPLPLAETASVFAEMLLNDTLAEKMSDKERRLLLAEEIDDMYATIMRQAYFTLFEIEAHHAIAERNATIDKVSEIYLNNLKEQFGNSLTITPDFQWEWLYIPHFYHTPFYCYAYSFGNLLVLSLYQQYKLEGKASFVPKYFNILSAGGSRKPEELLMDNGIDISKEEFWQQGFDYVAEKVQQLRNSN
ncbi:MAG: M3 family oligoendopeptidase [Thaumarchaeota archaeon]|nr:M3 family oligoendopeptidase [Nitrososphaerota archaeon]